MALPLRPPVAPQLARTRPELPTGDGWVYEPKWDGFRAIVFVDGTDVTIQSRNGRPLTRYFPELKFPEARLVLDGEIVILGDDGFADFDALQNRIHPAESRIRLLSEQTPARFLAFDLLAEEDESLLELPFSERRRRLELLTERGISLTPFTADAADAEQWLHKGEGVVAKETAAPYLPGERRGMAKIKRVRTIDCVVVGWRPGKHEGTVGALILGLYDQAGELHVVGHSSGFSAKEKRELPAMLARFETGRRGSGEPSRWSAGRELEWIELRPELVVEVTFDHVSGGRIRHGTKILRFRDDKKPSECSLDQLGA